MHTLTAMHIMMSTLIVTEFGTEKVSIKQPSALQLYTCLPGSACSTQLGAADTGRQSKVHQAALAQPAEKGLGSAVKALLLAGETILA